ncbi:CAP domain-containing protein [Candidatus Woesearchaeota archaeon]|nr:CAP domain-containing protein [Candidatus Woesearchaeota archaeon]
MSFYDSDRHLIPVMMQVISEKAGEKIYDFDLARQCNDHAVHMSRIGQSFHSDTSLSTGLPENVLSEIVLDGNFEGAVERIIDKMFSSPKHKHNIEQYPVIGIGTSVGYGWCGELNLYVTQRFRH